MKVDSVLSSSVIETLEVRLGEQRVTSVLDEARSLLYHRDDHVWCWNMGEQELLVAQTGSDGELQVMKLDECPFFTVTGLVVSRSGLWVALWGHEGVVVVEMPGRSGIGGRFCGGISKATCKTFTVLKSPKGDVQNILWHPGSLSESHLIVLTKEGKLALYNILEEDYFISELSISTGGKIATALGEAAVDLCFGAAGEAGQWPLFVLYGNSDVFCVSAGLTTEWRVEGPLEVMPPRDDNYANEACSIVACGGVLAIATVGGIIYHCVVLGGSSSSLHMYEMVELELGALSSESSNPIFSCPIRLYSDGRSPRYLASHRAGLHQVELPMVSVLREAEMMGITPDLENSSSYVEHMVCTLPTSSSKPAPVLGACVAYPPTTVLCLLSNNRLMSLSITPTTMELPTTISQDSEPVVHENTVIAFDSQIKSILRRSSTQPFLKSSSSTTLSSAETLELLTGVTGTLRKEYVARMHVAKEELMNRVEYLAMKKMEQEKLVQKLENHKAKVRDKAESLSEKYEDVKDKGLELGVRVESVLAKLQSKIPQLSDKELAMARELGNLNKKVQSLEGGINQLKDKEKYQRYQVDVRGRNGPSTNNDTRLDNIKEVLQKDSKSIADLVIKVQDLKKSLGM